MTNKFCLNSVTNKQAGNAIKRIVARKREIEAEIYSINFFIEMHNKFQKDNIMEQK